MRTETTKAAVSVLNKETTARRENWESFLWWLLGVVGAFFFPLSVSEDHGWSDQFSMIRTSIVAFCIGSLLTPLHSALVGDRRTPPRLVGRCRKGAALLLTICAALAVRGFLVHSPLRIAALVFLTSWSFSWLKCQFKVSDIGFLDWLLAMAMECLVYGTAGDGGKLMVVLICCGLVIFSRFWFYSYTIPHATSAEVRVGIEKLF